MATEPERQSTSKCYVATCQRPTAVTHTITGHFTSEDDLNLIVAKCTTLEVHIIGAEGLTPVLDTNVYGRISVLQIIRLPDQKTDSLFVCTEDYQYFVLAYNSETRKLVTIAKGDKTQRVGRPCENGQLGFVDMKHGMIGLHLFEGSIKIIPISRKGTIQEAFDLKIEELQVISITFLEGCPEPTIALLYQERQDDRHVKTYTINIKEKEVKPGPWTQNIIEPGANLLIPASQTPGAALIIGESTISYKTAHTISTVPMGYTTISCFAKVDASRILLGKRESGQGGLVMLFIDLNDSGDVSLRLENLGNVNVPSTIAYIDEGVVFVGCECGDSQLVKLNLMQDDVGSFVEILETYTNIGPILDFCVVDLEKQGQSQVVTCSGAYKNGSLRVVRNGIGINEFAELDMPGIQDIWALRENDSQHHNILALSLVGQTAFVSVDGEELEGIDIVGASKLESLHCANVCDGCWIQVVHSGVYLIDCKTKQLVAQWTPPEGKRINTCACSATQLVLAMGAHICYLTIDRSGLTLAREKTLEHEVACLDISSCGVVGSPSTFCLVGLWTEISLRVLRLADLQQVVKHELGGEIIPRAAIIANFGDAVYAFCALGDGTLWTYLMDPATGALTSNKRVRLGTKPISLNTMVYDNKVHVFAASDQPTVIYLSNGKLVFSNVNLSDVKKMCPLHTKPFPDCLAIVSQQGLMIGNVDDIQKLQIRTIPLGDAPYRIVHQQKTASFLILLHMDHHAIPEDESDVELGKLKLVNHTTLETMDEFKLEKQELPISAVSFHADSVNEYFCVGTAHIDENEDEPTKGRIIVLSARDGKLHQVCEAEVKGAVYTMLNLSEGKLVVGVNSMVQMFNWEAPDALTYECGHHGYVLVMKMRCRGEFILVGDLMRSCTLLRYTDSKFEEVASDGNNAFWIVSLEIFDEENFICAEDSYNFFTCKRNTDAMSEEERQNLLTSGEFHLGSYVNCIQTGTLAPKSKEITSSAVGESMMFGTQTGMLGVIIPIKDDLFVLLSKVSDRLVQKLSSVGDLDHTKWRAFKNAKRRTDSCVGFIDGDLIESYLDLDPKLMDEVVSKITFTENNEEIPLTTKHLLTQIEALGRLH